MSRIGKKPVAIPKGVKVAIDDGRLVAEGPKGKLEQNLVPGIKVHLEGEQAVVERERDDRQSRANQGLIRSLLANMVHGVTQGFERSLIVSGVGYRAEMSGDKLSLYLGFTNPTVHKIPSDVEVAVEKNTRVVVRGIDRQRVGQVAAIIRSTKSPDPYKLKGVMYEDETIKKKAGKKAVS